MTAEAAVGAVIMQTLMRRVCMITAEEGELRVAAAAEGELRRVAAGDVELRVAAEVGQRGCNLPAVQRRHHLRAVIMQTLLRRVCMITAGEGELRRVAAGDVELRRAAAEVGQRGCNLPAVQRRHDLRAVIMQERRRSSCTDHRSRRSGTPGRRRSQPWTR
jgi:hypothetical protein